MIRLMAYHLITTLLQTQQVVIALRFAPVVAEQFSASLRSALNGCPLGTQRPTGAWQRSACLRSAPVGA